MTAPHLINVSLPQPSHKVGACRRIGNFDLIDHWFTVPLTHGLIFGHSAEVAQDHPLAQETITVFAREVIDTSSQPTTAVEARPFMVYLQGGPGGASPRPASDAGWVAELAQTHRVILLDQRGTGNSTPLTAQTLTALGSVESQVQYAELFRADSIIADAEVVRDFLTVDRADHRWSTMGQSFGGFLTLSYLSFAPGSLKDSRMTAGLAPIRAHIDGVYRSTYARTQARNQEFFGWYPEDAALANRIAEHLASKTEKLPTGERLTPERFQMLGSYLGGNARIHQLHYILQSAFVEGHSHLSEQFIRDVASCVSFIGSPIYALLHEAIYADGPAVPVGANKLSPSPAPTRWSAQRISAELPQFAPDAHQLLFTGEHTFDWYFDQDPSLSPLAEAAHALAEKDDWGRLYDHEQLARNEVPLVAAAYVPDIYVDFEHSMNTANFVTNTRVWTSATHHHDGLGADGAMILGHLKNLLADMH